MTLEELNTFLEDHQQISWYREDPYIYFRNEDLAWYNKDESNATRVEVDKLGELSTKKLMMEINKGLEVEQITRITGYFTKISSWNKGKLGELRDRKREKGDLI